MNIPLEECKKCKKFVKDLINVILCQRQEFQLGVNKNKRGDIVLWCPEKN